MHGWEEVPATHTPDDRLISTIYKELPELNNSNKIQPLKNGQRSEIVISPKKTYEWPVIMWKDAQLHWLSGKHKSKPQEMPLLTHPNGC